MSDLQYGRSAQLDRVLSDLLRQSPEVEAAAVVSFDGLPMASAMPPSMDENRVAAMSAALLSLGERAAEGLGRGELSQVYVEGETGTVFLVSAEDEAVLVAVGARGAKVGLLLYEIKRSAAAVADALRASVGDLVDEPQDLVSATDDEPATDPEPPVTVEDAVAEPVSGEAHVETFTVDEDDPLGVGSRATDEGWVEAEQVGSELAAEVSFEALDDAQPEPADEGTAGDDRHQPADSHEPERELAGTAPQPTPDLGAWATFTPANSGSESGRWT